MTSKLVVNGTTTLTGVKSVTYHQSVNSGTDLRPGCVGSAYIEVECFGGQSVAPDAGDSIAYYRVDTSNNETLIGTFYAEPVVTTRNSYRFVAYDAASKLDVDYSTRLQAIQSNFPMTIYALVSDACSVAGVTLGSASWPLSSTTVNVFYADNLTCRQIIQWAAEIAGRFVRCNTSGSLVFGWYSSSSNSIGPGTGTNVIAYKQDGLRYDNYDVAAVTSVAVKPLGTEGAAYVYPTSVQTDTNQFVISGNLLTTDATTATMTAIARNVYEVLHALPTWRPAEVDLFPFENTFSAGDIVSVTDSQNVTFNTLVMKTTLSETVANLSSSGRETYLDTERSTEAALANLSASIVQIDKAKINTADVGTAIIDTLESEDITTKNLTVIDDNGNVIATFRGSAITLGETAKTHTALDYRSLKLIDKNSNEYFSVSDLRDSSGNYSAVDSFVGDGFTRIYELSFTPSGTVSVTVDGVTTTAYTYDSRGFITFTTAPTSGAVIEVTYDTQSNEAKAFTFGSRGSGTTGAMSFTAGFDNVASSGASIATGQSNVASGRYGHAEGSYTTASGDNSHAEGEHTVASGQASHADGYYTQATALGAQAHGLNTVASGRGQTVFGQYNATDTNQALIVGNGSSSSSRSNIFAVGWDGSVVASGKLTANGLNINDKIGSASMGTTATTLTGAIAEHEGDINGINGKLSGLIVYKTATIPNITLLSGGYYAINGYIPAAPTGYSLMFALIRTWSSVSTKDAISITWNGNYVIGTGGATVSGLEIMYYYIRSESFTAG